MEDGGVLLEKMVWEEGRRVKVLVAEAEEAADDAPVACVAKVEGGGADASGRGAAGAVLLSRGSRARLRR